MAKIIKAVDWIAENLNIYEQINRTDVSENSVEHRWNPVGIQQEGTNINAEFLNNLQKNGVYGILETTHTIVNNEDKYTVTNFDGIDDIGVFEELKVKVKINEINIGDNPKLILNNIEYPMTYSTETSFSNIKMGQLESNKIYDLTFNGGVFIVESSSLKATDKSLGLVTLERVDSVGMPFRGIFPYENKIITYKEAMELKDGIYSIEGSKYYFCLNNIISGKGMHNFGTLSKKTVPVLTDFAGAKYQTLLEYKPHNYSFGVTSSIMHFWDNSTDLNKNLNTSYNNSGLWTTNVGWSGFNFANPGYAKLGNGLTIQWGTAYGSTHAADYKYFPIAFDNAVLIGVACYGYIAASGSGSGFSMIDKFKFLVSHRTSDTTLLSAAVNWIAIGY